MKWVGGFLYFDSVNPVFLSGHTRLFMIRLPPPSALTLSSRSLLPQPPGLVRANWLARLLRSPAPCVCHTCAHRAWSFSSLHTTAYYLHFETLSCLDFHDIILSGLLSYLSGISLIPFCWPLLSYSAFAYQAFLGLSLRFYLPS